MPTITMDADHRFIRSVALWYKNVETTFPGKVYIFHRDL